MNTEAQNKLKFDRRLHRRKGWLSKEELEAELDALPDSAGKAHVGDDQSEVDSKQAPVAARVDAVPAGGVLGGPRDVGGAGGGGGGGGESQGF